MASGGTVQDDLNNAGVVTNNGAYLANVASNTGTVTNAVGGTWTGNVSNAGAFNNAGTLTGNLINTGGVATNTGSIN
ncbi:hypothetical protein ABTN71_19800, partial [Acinetobacter baumannii]